MPKVYVLFNGYEVGTEGKREQVLNVYASPEAMKPDYDKEVALLAERGEVRIRRKLDGRWVSNGGVHNWVRFEAFEVKG